MLLPKQDFRKETRVIVRAARSMQARTPVLPVVGFAGIQSFGQILRMITCVLLSGFVMIRLRNDTKDKPCACLIRIFDRSSGRPSHESNNDTIHFLIAVPTTGMAAKALLSNPIICSK